MKRIILIVFTTLWIATVGAQVIHVPADQPTIQEAIEASADGDTVLVDEGTYVEQINFNGKAITVSSLFILDGDTSHISRTIIDGSQAPEGNASVVSFEGCIDTTSVLAGFTITGGKGSTKLVGNNMVTSAGGISIEIAGGKVINNIVRNNEVITDGQVWAVAAGIGVANLGEQYNSVIRNNKFYDNHTLSNAFSFGAGISVHIEGGYLLIENNEIYGNISESTGAYKALGAGMEIETEYGTEPRIIIRNNYIHHNQVLCQASFGGGIYLVYGQGVEEVDPDSNVPVEIYNNIISENYSEDKGGGLAIWNMAPAYGFRQTVPDPIVTNNTIVNNRAADGAGIFNYDARTVLFNNILWNDLSPEGCREVFNNDINYGSYWTKNRNDGIVQAYYNLFSRPFSNGDEVSSISGIFSDPEFEPDSSAQLTENSPALGRAIDSLNINSQWYYKPETDYFGNTRPDAVDRFSDLGAIESFYARPLLANADLGSLGLWDRNFQPAFHPDTLSYMLSVPDTVTMVPELDLFLADAGAAYEVDAAKDLFSSETADRTTLISVTADDGSTKKSYSVLFNLNSTDATLSGITLGLGRLEPIFATENNHYAVWLSCGSTETPVSEPMPSDSNATVTVTPALDVTSARTDLRITSIKVISEEGVKFQQNYYIEFNVEECPALTLISDTVDLQHDIQANSSADGWIYLVPENTPGILDSIKSNAIDSVAAISNETVSIPTSERDPVTYAVYAVSKYGSVSGAVSVVLRSGTGLAIMDAPSIRIFPNPVKGVLYLSSDSPISSVQIFNAIGTRLLHLSGPMEVVDLGKLDRGPYFIVVTTESGVISTQKIIKL